MISCYSSQMSRGPTRKASSAQASLCVLASLGLTLAVRDKSTHRSDTSCLLHSGFGQVHIKYAANRVWPQQTWSCMFNFRDDEATDRLTGTPGHWRGKDNVPQQKYTEYKTQPSAISRTKYGELNLMLLTLFHTLFSLELE